ncbi:NADPH-dependent FMN reductase [Clostridium puniceum]|uniref:NADPH-dependent FMN reductase n=1 Tax=Clostridium puniceum TaxID=29367 RepID=A0A1S8TDP8_9CLOT|nr:NAD(P)H-dependent oxidoreductase [Clostridium puniceum]OOM75751.1 NADPH-dependent FMN reductase [Clostridium puniceum]
MKIIILNGSPKSERSVTMQSIKYLEQNYENYEFQYIHIVAEMKGYEKDTEKLKSLCTKIQEADAVIWAFSLYHALVHSQYKRFIELIFENKLESYFLGKYTSAFSTSIHYADIHAHNYIRAIAEDLGMNYVEYLSHEMNDLTKEKSRRELKLFFENLLTYIEEGLTTSKLFKPMNKSTFKYIKGETDKFIDTTKKIIILTDAAKEDYNLNEMIDKYKSHIKNPIEVLNLNQVDIKGPCLGCCKCAAQNKCVYDYKDGYREFLDYIIKNGDVIIFAGTIKDRYLSSRFKLYYDRSFCYNHVPFFKTKHIGYIISGNLSENENLKQILEFHTQGSNLIGLVTDEAEDNAAIDNQIYTFAKMSVRYSERNYFKPETFLEIASNKLFADSIEGNLGAIFLADYNYYKKNAMLKKVSFKNKMKGIIMRYFMKREKFRQEVQKNMINFMIADHKKILEKGRR